MGGMATVMVIVPKATVMAILTAMAAIPFDIITILAVEAVIILDQDIGSIIDDGKR